MGSPSKMIHLFVVGPGSVQSPWLMLEGLKLLDQAGHHFEEVVEEVGLLLVAVLLYLMQ